MNLPFTTDAFLAVFAAYNSAIWPFQIVAYGLGLVVVAALIKPRETLMRFAFAALAIYWAFTGIGYHLMFFAPINSIAPLFAAFFILQGVIFLATAVHPGALQLRVGPDVRSIAGLLIIVYAMAVYPVLGVIAGHGLMAGPMFGVTPCPTTIFTLGILVIARGRWVAWLSIIPVLWSLIGLSAAIQLGISEDLGMPVAGALLVAMLAATACRDQASRRRLLRASP